MRFRYIFIANLTEYARPYVELLENKGQKRKEIEEDFGLCDRFLISGGDNRVLITPWPINKGFLRDTCQIFKFKNILNLSPQKPTVSLCEDILRERKLRDTLIKIIKENTVEIYSYVGSDEFLELINFLKKQGLKFKTPEAPKKPGLVKFFGSKAGFRETFAKERLGGSELHMPEGYIAKNKKEILFWAKYFFDKDKSFVIKTNYGLAGAGSEIVEARKIKKKDFTPVLEKIIAKHPYWLREKTVVEEFLNADLSICGGSPSVEFAVLESRTCYLYSCGMRIIKGGVFRGIEIGKGAVPLWVEEKMKSYGFKFAKVLHKVGYRGFFDTDFVNTKNKKLYCLEANIRQTGGTHVYEAGLRLLGKDFLKKYYLVSNNLYENKKIKELTYKELKKKLQPLLYPLKGEQKGIILTMVSLLPYKCFGYIVIGKTRKETFSLEEEMEKRIKSL